MVRMSPSVDWLMCMLECMPAVATMPRLEARTPMSETTVVLVLLDFVVLRRWG